MLRKLINLEKPFDFLKSGGRWFVLVLVISALIRLYMVIFTEGTYDIQIWQRHAQEIQRTGLIEYYRNSLGNFNHSPVAGYLASFCLSLSKWLAIPFKILFRIPLALLDFLTAFYLIKIFSGSRYKYVYVAFYLLCPLTFILSSFHGNTDSLLGLLGLASLYYASINAYITAGIILGAGVWVKWVILLILPALFFGIPSLRNKMRFLASLSITSLAGYLWALLQAPELVIKSVFGYGGQLIQTTAGTPVWGNRVLYAYAANAYLKVFSFPTEAHFINFLNMYIVNNSAIIFSLVILYSWLKAQRERPALETGRTIGQIYCIFYGITNFWSFQYFAWAIPFWLFLDKRLALAIYFFTTSYIYLLYSFVCGSYFLLGDWDFIGHPYLPKAVLFFRDACILLFIGTTVYFFGKALRDKACLRRVKTKPAL